MEKAAALLPPPPEPSSDDSFSVVFRGARDRPLHQATYSVDHTSLGTFPLFVVPIYPDADALNYEAIFNRMEQQYRTRDLA